MLNEKFDASLVMLRRRLNWKYTDIFYKKAGKIHSKEVLLSSEGERKLLSREVNLGDMMLYEAMNSSWHSQPEVQQEDFWDEVSCSQ